MGIVPGPRRYRGLGALLLAERVCSSFLVCGRAGAGFSEPLVSHRRAGLQKLNRRTKLAASFAPVCGPGNRCVGLGRDNMILSFPTHAAVAPAMNSALRFSTRWIVPETSTPNERIRVVREPHRGAYDRESIDKILDEGFVCHVGFTVNEQPYVIPTMYARVGDAIYFHGSAASRMLRGASAGIAVCITVTIADGLVLARSVFNHSMNYRSVVALGEGDAGGCAGGKTGGAAGLYGEDSAGALERCPATEREGVESYQHPAAAAHGSFREDAHWPGGRRRGGLRFAGVGGNRAAAPPG